MKYNSRLLQTTILVAHIIPLLFINLSPIAASALAALPDSLIVKSVTSTSCSVPNLPSEAIIEPTNAQLRWYTSQVNSIFEIQWRSEGTIDWPNSATVSDGVYDLQNLIPGTKYEWRVKSLCFTNSQDGFTKIRSFIALCTVAEGYDDSENAGTSGYVSWGGFASTGHQIRWRRKNSQDEWSLGNKINGTFYAPVTGLTNGKTYEWQLRRFCKEGLSDWSASYTFVTACGSAFFSRYMSVGVYSADLRWTLPGPDANFLLQWREAGDTTWPNSVTVLADSPNSLTIAYRFYTLTGLKPGTTYEARLKVLCTDGSTSDFANFSYFAPNFTTYFPCTSFQSVRNGFWNDPAIWSCNRIPTRDDDVEVLHTLTMPLVFPNNKVKSIRYGFGGVIKYESGAILATGAN